MTKRLIEMKFVAVSIQTNDPKAASEAIGNILDAVFGPCQNPPTPSVVSAEMTPLKVTGFREGEGSTS